MIDFEWIITDANFMEIDKSINFSYDLEILKNYVINHHALLEKHVIKVGRKVNNENFEVYAWNPFQIIYLNSEHF